MEETMPSNRPIANTTLATSANLGGGEGALGAPDAAPQPANLSDLAAAIGRSAAVTSAAASKINQLGSDLRSFKAIRSTRDAGVMVRDARKQMKYSQQRLADLAGVGRRFISELEGGKPTLEFDRVAKVCAACGIDLFARLRSERP